MSTIDAAYASDFILRPASTQELFHDWYRVDPETNLCYFWVNELTHRIDLPSQNLIHKTTGASLHPINGVTGVFSHQMIGVTGVSSHPTTEVNTPTTWQMVVSLEINDVCLSGCCHKKNTCRTWLVVWPAGCSEGEEELCGWPKKIWWVNSAQ